MRVCVLIIEVLVANLRTYWGSKFIFSFNILNDNGNENGFTCKNVSITHDDDLTPFSSKFLANLNSASAF